MYTRFEACDISAGKKVRINNESFVIIEDQWGDFGLLNQNFKVTELATRRAGAMANYLTRKRAAVLVDASF